MAIEVINPATGELLKSYEVMNKDELAQILDDVHAAQVEWAKTSFEHRANLMRNLAKLYEDKNQEMATIITQEMGKPITQAKAEISKCVTLALHYADKTEEYLKPVHFETEFQKSYTWYEPLGIIYAIMPWNYPFWQVLRFAVPNLMNGNAAVLSHAPNSTGAALAIEAMFREAGFPENLFRSLVIDVELSSFVTENKHVKGVTLTGSERAGKAVASNAGTALKKCVLELGGSDPYLILEDADLDLAAKECAVSRLGNTGQVCIASKRIIVVDAIRDAFIEKLKKEMEAFVCGDPMLPETTMGPMARDDLWKQLDDQVQRSKAQGLECVVGGAPLERAGFYYPATLFLDVKKGTVPYDEELFGPVVAVLYAKDEAHAIEIANDSPYGLGACVYTQNEARGEEIARDELHSGMCTVNKFCFSDPRLPFGGTGLSGFGRELADAGVKEFMNAKTVVVK